MKEEYKSEFYESVEDPLATFRKSYGGARIGKNGIDPFEKDPDSIQGDHEQKLVEKQGNLDLGGW